MANRKIERVLWVFLEITCSSRVSSKVLISVLSHPNFGNPNSNLTSPLFGHSTQTLASSLGSGGANGGFNPLYQIGGPRSIQLALKLQF